MSVLPIYGALALFHVLMEILLGHANHCRQRRRGPLGVDDGAATPVERQSVTVVVPVFNEPPETLRACLSSIAAQDHQSVEVIVVDDGSANQSELRGLYAEFGALARWTTIALPENVGKREAHRIAFDRASGEFVVTIDSDTVLHHPDAIRRLLRRFRDPRVGAVTSYVAVGNGERNLLTRLIAVRYWMAFHQERAAQSLFGVMMCCSGPFSAFRRSVVEASKQAYVEQRFLGRRCTYGDDRHLTNLALRDGWRVVFDESVSCLTEAPTSVRGYVRQQVRWNKSFYREALWSLRYLAWRRSPYLLLELMLQILLPFCLLAALGTICAATLAGDPNRLIGYVALIIPVRIASSGIRAAAHGRSPLLAVSAVRLPARPRADSGAAVRAGHDPQRRVGNARDLKPSPAVSRPRMGPGGLAIRIGGGIADARHGVAELVRGHLDPARGLNPESEPSQ